MFVIKQTNIIRNEQIINGIFHLSFRKFPLFVLAIMKDINNKIDEYKNAEGKISIPKLKQILPIFGKNSGFLFFLLFILF